MVSISISCFTIKIGVRLMSETYEKVTDDILKVISNDINTHIFEISRTELETQLTHLKLDKDKTEFDFNKRIEVLRAKIAILDS